MSWIEPEPYDRRLFAALDPNSAFGRLCLVLAPALRVEPRLLRNARRRYLPRTDAGLENRLWFSRVVESRSARSVSLRPGLARLLVDHLATREGTRGAERLAAICAFIAEQTRDWDELDRLEQALRWAIRDDDRPRVGELLRELLRRIGASGGDRERADLARWIKGALPPLRGATDAHRESGWLAQFAGATLGDPSLVLRGPAIPPDPMPAWLGALVPAGAGLALGLRLGRDGDRLILECVEPEPGLPRLDLTTPAPAPVRIDCENQPELSPGWAPLFPGCRIPCSWRCRILILQTLDGRRFRLTAGTPEVAPPPGSSPPHRVVLVHAAGDEAPARRIAALLERQSIQVRVERHASLQEGVPAIEVADPEEQIVGLWSERAAKALAADSRRRRKGLPATTPAYRLLVRLDQTPWPEGLASSGPEPAWIDLSAARGEWGPAEARQLLVALAAGPSEESVAEVQSPPRAEMERLLAELHPETSHGSRLVIGDRLAALGDPRPGVGLDAKGLPDIDWVEIPAGPFLYGENKETRELPTFFIARYPITNAQYQAFIDAGGYQDDRWWKDLKRLVEKKGGSRWPHSNRPRTDVSWYEAVAFCRWLSAQRGYEVRLPTEWEWEKAARGTDGREYPWGDDYRSGLANVYGRWAPPGRYASSQEGTTAVGMYPQGASPYGVLDLAGNVWEWCLNEHHTSENMQVTGRVDRVVRGGCWGYDLTTARSANGNYYDPGWLNINLGFRVLCWAPIESPNAGSRSAGPLKS